MLYYLMRILGWPIGLRFAPDNHVMPIFRLGRFHRVGGPGFFFVIPLLEQTYPPVYMGGRLADFVFTDVISSDNIPFSAHMTIFFTFNPSSAPKALLTQLIQLSNQELKSRLEAIVRSHTGEELRNLMAQVQAEKICSLSTRLTLKRDLSHYLGVHLHDLGFTLGNNPILIQEIMPDPKFRATMLNVEQHEAILRKLTEYEDKPELIDKAVQAEFLDSLEGHEGRVDFISNLDLDYLHLPRGDRSKSDKNSSKQVSND